MTPLNALETLFDIKNYQNQKLIINVKLKHSDLKNLSWVNWLDPLRQVNQNFDQKVFEEIEFDKIKLNITREKL